MYVSTSYCKSINSVQTICKKFKPNRFSKLPDVVQVGKERYGVRRIFSFQVDRHDVAAVLEGVRDERPLVLVVQRRVDVFNAAEGDGKKGAVVVDLKKKCF